MYALSQKAIPHSEVITREIDEEEMVLLHMETQIYFSLNVTGLRIWDGVQRGLSFGEISQQLRQEFQVEQDRAATSVFKLLKELSQRNLIHIGSEKE